MSTRVCHTHSHHVLVSTSKLALLGALLSAGCHSLPKTDVARAGVSATPPAAPADPNRGCQLPVGQRTSDAGCWLTVETRLGALSGPQYWHVYTYGSAAAADSARGPRGTVAESFGKHWLFTIEAENWRPTTGDRVAVVGPIAVTSGVPYTARYMEAVFPAGYRTGLVGHRHSGAEAWYVLTGAQCLETPGGPMVVRAGEGAMVPSGPPMQINAVGPETRRSVLVVLHPTAEPWVTSAPDWTPKGICPK